MNWRRWIVLLCLLVSGIGLGLGTGSLFVVRACDQISSPGWYYNLNCFDTCPEYGFVQVCRTDNCLLTLDNGPLCQCTFSLDTTYCAYAPFTSCPPAY